MPYRGAAHATAKRELHVPERLVASIERAVTAVALPGGRKLPSSFRTSEPSGGDAPRHAPGARSG